MTTNTRVRQGPSRRTNMLPHRLGMGWHYIWEYDPPLVHQTQRADGTSYNWEEIGESSEGCIMWLADRFVMQRLSVMTAREIYRLAYKERDRENYDDAWLTTDALRDAWAEYTVLPRRWTATMVHRLFEDLEDVNYHSFLATLIELVEEHAPKLADALSDWGKGMSSRCSVEEGTTT